MDVAAVSQIVGSVGFPIAMCLLMAVYIKGEQDTMRGVLNDLRTAIVQLTAEIKDLQEKRAQEGFYDEVRRI